MRKLILSMFALTTAILLSSCDTTTQLFNGQDFAGFEPLGGAAEFYVEDGAMVGVSTKGEPNSFMATAESYGDFILEYEVLNDPLLNSGVQIRSHALDNGSVYGYQIEIDPSTRAWSGGIYDEGGRGWLVTLADNPVGQAAYNNDGWNHYRVEAVGDNIRVWLNGVSTANLIDDCESEGFIAFQVHAAGGEQIGKKTMWRNITIDTENVESKLKQGELATEVNRTPNTLSQTEAEAGWKLLFDGTEQSVKSNWRADGGEEVHAGWTAKDGYLFIDRESKKGGGGIITNDEYSAFEFSLEFMLTPGANSGIKYFYTRKLNPKNDKYTSYGLEYQLLDDVLHKDAKLYTTYPGSRTLAGLYDMIPAGAKRFSGIGKWNQAVIKAYPNGHIEHWLNGFKVIEYERGSADFKERVANSKYSAPYYNIDVPFGEDESGNIHLQDHGDVVYFRSIKVRNLE